MSIIKTEFSFMSSNGVNTVRGIKVYSDDVEHRGLLQISHGMVEHYDRYIDFMSYMAENGFVVYCNDHLGHKHSAENYDDLGYFAKNSGYLYVMNDLIHTAEIAKEENPGLKIILLGHSMGSFFARYLVSQKPDLYSAVIISGTGYASGSMKPMISFCSLLIKFKGERYRSEFLKKTVFGSYLDKIENPKTANDWLTRDESVVEKYNDDEFCTFNFTLSGYRDLVTINILCNEKEVYDKTPDMPLMLVSGSMDPVGGYGVGVMRVFEDYKKSGKSDVTLKLYDGGRHEMLNEINKDEVYKDILKWCESKLEA